MLPTLSVALCTGYAEAQYRCVPEQPTPFTVPDVSCFLHPVSTPCDLARLLCDSLPTSISIPSGRLDTDSLSRQAKSSLIHRFAAAVTHRPSLSPQISAQMV